MFTEKELILIKKIMKQELIYIKYDLASKEENYDQELLKRRKIINKILEKIEREGII